MQNNVNVVIRSYGLTFSKACLAALNNTEFVTMQLEGTTLAVRACGENDEGGFRCVKLIPSINQQLLRVSSKQLLKAIEFENDQTYDKVGVKNRGSLQGDALRFELK